MIGYFEPYKPIWTFDSKWTVLVEIELGMKRLKADGTYKPLVDQRRS